MWCDGGAGGTVLRRDITIHPAHAELREPVTQRAKGQAQQLRRIGLDALGAAQGLLQQVPLDLIEERLQIEALGRQIGDPGTCERLGLTTHAGRQRGRHDHVRSMTFASSRTFPG